MQELQQNFALLNISIEDGINWASGNLPEESKKGIIRNLKNHRRFVNKLVRASGEKPCIALFGESQVGKSYLVSNMCKKPGESVQYVINPGSGDPLNFIEQINPAGGGGEATGLVTRFTVGKNTAAPACFRLRLFSAVDIIKIFANSYLSDLKDYRFIPDISEIQDALKAFVALPRIEEPGMNEDTVLDIQEYLESRFTDSFIVKELKKINFWDDAISVINRVPVQESWKVFQFLWGKQEFFNELFIKLITVLRDLGFPKEVDISQDCLLPKEISLIDVMRVKQLFMTDEEFQKEYAVFKVPDNAINVKVIAGGQAYNINRNVLASIGAELILYLPETVIESEDRAFLKIADILDFPGARAREVVAEDTFANNKLEEKVQLFIRGKISYLFDFFNMNLDISSLIWCMHEKQCEVRYIPSLITKWIADTIGRSPDDRGKREEYLRSLINANGVGSVNPLLVVNTKFNIDLQGKPDEPVGDPNVHLYKWDLRFNRNFHDFICTNEADKWPDQWTKNNSFKNVFLLRDPKYSQAVFETKEENGQFVELKVKDDYYEKKLKDEKESFISHSYVKQHVLNPLECWEETTQPNKSGVDYIVRFLAPTVNPILKNKQINDLFNQVSDRVVDELDDFYEGGDLDDLLKKARKNGLATKLALERLNDDRCFFGVFLKYLVCPEEIAWREYWKLMNDEATGKDKIASGPTISPDLLAVLKRLQINKIACVPGKDRYKDVLQKLMDRDEVDNEEELLEIYKEAGFIIELIEPYLEGDLVDIRADEADIFAQNLISTWLSSLTSLKSETFVDQLGLPAGIVKMIISQIDKNVVRVGLKVKIAAAVRNEIAAYHVTNNQNFDLVARLASSVLNSFVTTAGWALIAEEKRPDVKKGEKKVFTYSDKVKFPGKKDLQLGNNFPGHKLFDSWKIGMKESFEANVLFEKEIHNAEKAKANKKLGDILTKVESNKVS